MITDSLTKKKLVIKSLIGIVLMVCGVAYRPVVYVALGYCLVMIISSSSLDLVCMLFSWLSFSAIFKFTPDSMSIFTLLELAAVLILAFRHKNIGSDFLFIWLIYVIYLFIGAGAAYTDFIKIAIVPILFYYLMRSVDSAGLKSVVGGYLLGVLLSSFTGMLSDIIPELSDFVSFKSANLSSSTSMRYFSVTRFSGLWADPNYYSIHLIMCIAIISIYYAKKELKSLVFFVLASIIIFFGALSGSKSFFLTLLVIIVFLLYLLLREKQYLKLTVFTSVVAIFVILIMSGGIAIFNTTIQRLFSSSDSDITTGRIRIWISYLELFRDNTQLLLVGSGLGNGFPLRVPHNTILDYLSMFGITGSSLFLTSMFAAVNKAWGRSKKGGNYIPAISLVVLYFFLSMLYSIDFVFETFLALGFIYLNNNNSILKIYTTNLTEVTE